MPHPVGFVGVYVLGGLHGGSDVLDPGRLLLGRVDLDVVDLGRAHDVKEVLVLLVCARSHA